MAELAVLTKHLDFQLEQVQDFTPTPMTVATEMWYTGYDPYTLEPVFSAKTPREKLAQRQFFFWYKPEERRGIEQSLRRIGRQDLIPQLFNKAQESPRTYSPHQSQKAQESYKPHSPHENPRTSPRTEEPRKEKRGRHRRHP